MGMAIRENWDLRVNKIFPHHRIQWTEHQWNPNDTSKLNFPEKKSTFDVLTEHLAPAWWWQTSHRLREPGPHPALLGNPVSTFPPCAWLPVSQLVRKFLQTNTDTLIFLSIRKTKPPPKASSERKGTGADQNRTLSRNFPVRKWTLEVNLTTCPGNTYPWNKILQTSSVYCTLL